MTLRDRVHEPEVRTYPNLCVQVLADEALQGTGVFVIPFQRGNLLAEMLVLRDVDIPVPLVGLRMQREGNRYWFGRIFRLDDFVAKIIREDEQSRMVDEQGREIPDTPEDRLAHILRMCVLPRSDSQKRKWAYWGDRFWKAAVLRELQNLQEAAVRALAER